MMVIFSEEFGSEDAFVDALQTARWMAERDAHSFCPHMGIAAGIVTVGYVGTPLKYSCSVFGVPVVLAKRCASIKPQSPGHSSIFFPADLWMDRSFEKIFPPQKLKKSDGQVVEEPQGWKLLPSRTVQMKNMPDTQIIEVTKEVIDMPQESAEERSKQALLELHKSGMYKPLKT